MIDVVCGVIQNGQGEVLLCQRAPHQSQGGFWEFPGGKIEKGETEEGALQRELLEELECLVAVRKSLTCVEYVYSHASIRLIPQMCVLEDGSPRAIEHAAIAWVAIDKLLEYDLAPADIPIAEEVRSLFLNEA